MNEPTTTRRIIGQALTDLKIHASKLQTVHDRARGELDEAGAFVKALEKVLRGKQVAASRPPLDDAPRPAGPGRNPRAAFLAKVIALIADGPRSIRSIADHFGSSLPYTEQVIKKAAERGQLTLSGEEVSVR